MVWILFLMLAGSVGAGAWQMYSMYQTMISIQTDLQQTKFALGKVTGDVSAAGASMSKSDSDFRSELKAMNSEIRKLWDVSNKRNKAWINDNKEILEKNSKKLEYAANSAEKAIELAEAGKKLASRSRDNVDKIQSKLSEVEQLLKALTTEQLVSNSDLTANLDALKQNVERLGRLAEEQKRVGTQVEDHIARQNELSESFSSYRKQTNRRLQQMENTIRELTRPDQSGGLSMVQ